MVKMTEAEALATIWNAWKAVKPEDSDSERWGLLRDDAGSPVTVAVDVDSYRLSGVLVRFEGVVVTVRSESVDITGLVVAGASPELLTEIVTAALTEIVAKLRSAP